jgi:alpha-tubulin suppressor-like RCC1 family protein
MRRVTALVVVGLVTALIAGGAVGQGGGAASTTPFASAIGAGLIHSCALTSGGGVKCWGFNGHYELGDGTAELRTRPSDVSRLSSGVRAIAIGSRHGCALKTTGGPVCWGYNRYGQLGDGTRTNSSVPVEVAGLRSEVTAIVASFHTCALEADGVVQCWGSNSAGQLGDGTREDRSAPVDVIDLGRGVAAIAAGDSHSCALTSDGAVKCWGDNSSGQLGDGTTVDRWTPAYVSGLGAGVIAIVTGGLHSCALTSGGGVKCWGANALGQLGDGTRLSRSRPVEVAGLSRGVRAITAGLRHTCALTSTGRVKCWGLNDYGQLGDGRAIYHSKPANVFGLGHRVVAIAAGGLHACALTRAGSAKCWGRNLEGELGDGRQIGGRRPVGVVGFGPAPATVALVIRSAQVTPARVAPIKLRCSEGARCRGALTISVIVHGRRTRSSRRGVEVTLGTSRFSIARGRTAILEVRLTGRGFGVLVRMKRLRTRVGIRYAQPDGTTTAATGVIILRTPRLPPGRKAGTQKRSSSSSARPAT